MNKILKPTGGCVDMWLLSQNISVLSFTNSDLSALKYGGTMENANEFFELMKKKHKNLVISECGLFLDKTNCFARTISGKIVGFLKYASQIQQLV